MEKAPVGAFPADLAIALLALGLPMWVTSIGQLAAYLMK